MSLKASSVSRYLGAKGFDRSESCGSYAQTTGFRCEEAYDFNHRPAVRVSWIPGTRPRREESRTEVAAAIHQKVSEMCEALSVRYNVQLETPDAVFGGDPHLMVTAKEGLTP